MLAERSADCFRITAISSSSSSVSPEPEAVVVESAAARPALSLNTFLNQKIIIRNCTYANSIHTSYNVAKLLQPKLRLEGYE
jgi:hypothetical protein